MPWINFQSDKIQLQEIFESIFAEIDGVLYETYSKPNHELRSFKSVTDLNKAFELGTDAQGNGAVHLLALWVPSVMTKPNIRTILLNAGGTRQVVEGCGLFHIQLGGKYQDTITTSTIGFFTEAGAKRKCTVKPGADSVNWENQKKLASVLRKVIKHISRPAKNV